MSQSVTSFKVELADLEATAVKCLLGGEGERGGGGARGLQKHEGPPAACLGRRHIHRGGTLCIGSGSIPHLSNPLLGLDLACERWLMPVQK